MAFFERREYRPWLSSFELSWISKVARFVHPIVKEEEVREKSRRICRHLERVIQGENCSSLKWEPHERSSTTTTRMTKV